MERIDLSFFVDSHVRNIPVQLFQNPCTGYGGEVI